MAFWGNSVPVNPLAKQLTEAQMQQSRWEQVLRAERARQQNVAYGEVLQSSNFIQSLLTRNSAAKESATAVVEMPKMSQIGTVEVTVPDMADERSQLAMEAERVLGYRGLRKEIQAPSQLRCVLAKLEIEVLDPDQVDAYKKQAAEHLKTSGKMTDPMWLYCDLASYFGHVPDFVLSKAIEIKRELPAARFYVEYLANDPFLIVTTLGAHSSGSAKSHPQDVAYLEVWDERSFEAAHK